MKGTRLTGLWKNKSKAGKNYLAGNLGSARIMVLPNDRKQKETDPDYTVFLAPREKPPENGQGNGNGKGEEQEDIPF